MSSDAPMTCDAVDAALRAYVANTLDDRTAEAIEAHVSQCARCEALLEEATRIDVTVFAPPLPADVRASVLAARPVGAPARSNRWMRPVAAVAVLAAAATLYVTTSRAPSRASSRAPSRTITSDPAPAATVDAVVAASTLASQQAASEFRSLDAAAQELEAALKAAPDDREMRAYLDAVQARRAELAEKVAEAGS